MVLTGVRARSGSDRVTVWLAGAARAGAPAFSASQAAFDHFVMRGDARFGGTQGDVNFDGRVDILDLQALLTQFGLRRDEPSAALTADLTEDGLVNTRDLIIALSRYGMSN